MQEKQTDGEAWQNTRKNTNTGPALSPAQLPGLESIQARERANGVTDLQWLSRDEARTLAEWVKRAIDAESPAGR